MKVIKKRFKKGEPAFVKQDQGEGDSVILCVVRKIDGEYKVDTSYEVYDIMGMNSIQEPWQISRSETTLDKYNIEEQLLFEEISQDKLTFRDVRQRCDDLWKLIPVNMDLNPVRLHTLIVQKFRDDPEWYKYSKTYTIKIDDIDDEAVERYIKAVSEKFKKRDI